MIRLLEHEPNMPIQYRRVYILYLVDVYMARLTNAIIFVQQSNKKSRVFSAV